MAPYTVNEATPPSPNAPMTLGVTLQTAFLSPRVAMAAYYLKGVAPDWELTDIYCTGPDAP